MAVLVAPRKLETGVFFLKIWQPNLKNIKLEVTKGGRRFLFVSVHEKDTGLDRNYTNATTAIVSYPLITRHRELQNYSLVIFVEDKVIIMMD
jgi:hypothetical protein